jgi:hypothetical protein
MTRRLVKQDRSFEAFRETRPAFRRQFGPGTVLNILQRCGLLTSSPA